MNFNTVAASVLVVGISAMVISKVGDILVPEKHFVHKAEPASAGNGSSGSGGQKAPEDPSVGAALAKADAAKGEKLVRSRCGSCHTWTKGGKNSTGPNLWGVVGRKKGSHEGFSYSSAMQKAGGEWSYKDLYEFLKSPSGFVKGTKMSYRMRKFAQRADVIAFLRTQADSPMPLPKAAPAPKKEEPKKDGEKKTDAGKKDGVDKAAMEAKKKAEEAKKAAEEAAKKAAAEKKRMAEEAARKAKEAAEAKAKEAAMKAAEEKKKAEEAAKKAAEKAAAEKKAAEEAARKAKAEAEAKAKEAAMKAAEEKKKAEEAAKKAAEDAAKKAKEDADKKSE